MILKMPTVGNEKRTVLFYGVQCEHEAFCLRGLITDVINNKKNLKSQVLETWKYHDAGGAYRFVCEREDGIIEYKKI